MAPYNKLHFITLGGRDLSSDDRQPLDRGGAGHRAVAAERDRAKAQAVAGRRHEQQFGLVWR
jgi:hypothetical protein